MRTQTVTYQLFEISELSKEAQEKAHSEWLSNGYFYGFTSDNRHTLDVFCELLGVKIGNCQYDAYTYNYQFFTEHNGNIEDLKGSRLATYLINHFWSHLFTPKYYWNSSKNRKSRIFVENYSVLTGYYIDDTILEPIYQFLERPSDKVTFLTLIDKCLDRFFRACRDDMESSQTIATFIEESQANDWEYMTDGKFYH